MRFSVRRAMSMICIFLESWFQLFLKTCRFHNDNRSINHLRLAVKLVSTQIDDGRITNYKEHKIFCQRLIMHFASIITVEKKSQKNKFSLFRLSNPFPNPIQQKLGTLTVIEPERTNPEASRYANFGSKSFANLAKAAIRGRKENHCAACGYKKNPFKTKNPSR